MDNIQPYRIRKRVYSKKTVNIAYLSPCMGINSNFAIRSEL